MFKCGDKQIYSITYQRLDEIKSQPSLPHRNHIDTCQTSGLKVEREKKNEQEYFVFWAQRNKCLRYQVNVYVCTVQCNPMNCVKNGDRHWNTCTTLFHMVLLLLKRKKKKKKHKLFSLFLSLLFAISNIFYCYLLSLSHNLIARSCVVFIRNKYLLSM